MILDEDHVNGNGRGMAMAVPAGVSERLRTIAAESRRGADTSEGTLDPVEERLAPRVLEFAEAPRHPSQTVEAFRSGGLAFEAGVRAAVGDARLHYEAPLRGAEITSTKYLQQCSGHFDLVYMAQGAADEAGARLHEMDAREIVSRSLVALNGFVLIEDGATGAQSVPRSKYSRRIFCDAGFHVLDRGERLLMCRKAIPIPKVIHFVPGVRDARLHPSRFRCWLKAHEERGWAVRQWNVDALLRYCERVAPPLHADLQNASGSDSRFLVAACLIANELGGVILDETVCFELGLENVVRDRRLAFSDRSTNVEAVFYSHFVASAPRHPFWNGSANDLRGRESVPAASAFDSFFRNRIRDASRFLAEWDRPEVLRCEAGLAAPPAAAATEVKLPLNSCLCAEEDFAAEWLQSAARTLGEQLGYRRRLWELCFAWQALTERGFARKGRRGLFLGNEASCLADALVSTGCELTVLDVSRLQSRNRSRSQAHSQLGPHSRIEPRLYNLSLSSFGTFDFSVVPNGLAGCNFATLSVIIEEALRGLKIGGVLIITGDCRLTESTPGEPAAAGAATLGELRGLAEALEQKGGKLIPAFRLGTGGVETHLSWETGTASSLREKTGDHVITSAGLIVTRAQPLPEWPCASTARATKRAPTEKFLFAGAGLGDVARRFYKTNTYTVLEGLQEPTSVICYSHNPSALEFFRFHPNHAMIVLFDMAHLHIALARDRSVKRSDRNRLLFAACGFSPADDITQLREPAPIGMFHAPDAIAGSGGHIVVHPFGRGWGNWPEPVTEAVLSGVAAAATGVTVYVICADYTTADGRRKDEEVRCSSPNVVRLRNPSAPATFSLVASASRFIGTFSSLSQVAAFEGVPSVVLHPARCKDFEPPMSPYAQSVWDGNGVAFAYERFEARAVRQLAAEFVAGAPEGLRVAERLRQHITPLP